MASGGQSVSSAFKSISSRHFECAICTDRYNKPKILDCLHTFCLRCLEDYTAKIHQGSSIIPCPTCRSETQLSPETGVNGLKTNFHMVALMEDFALQEKLTQQDTETKMFCEICTTEEEATHRCLECAQNLCAGCGQRHTRFAATSNHTVSTLEEIRKGNLQPSKKLTQQDPKCPNHKDEAMRFFCTTCQVPICRDCTVVDHPKPEHVYVGTNQATAKYKQSLMELYFPLEGKLKQIKQSLANVSKTKLKLGASVDRITVEVRSKADELRQEITKQENIIIGEIKRIGKERQQKLAAMEKSLDLLSERIQHSLKITKDMTHSATDGDFLSMFSTISKDIKLLSGQDFPEVDSSLSYLRFKQKQGVNDINLGELVASGRWDLWRRIGKEGNGPGEFNFAYGVAFRQFDEIAVADFKNQRVQILGVDGANKWQIPLRGNPCAVALTGQDKRLVAVCRNQVKVFNQDNSLALEFSTLPQNEVGKTQVELYSAAVKKNGNILIGDADRMVLTEHDPRDGSILRTVPVAIKPWFLAVCNDNKLVISNWDEAVARVIDGEGETLFTLHPTIEGRPVKRCGGVCSNSSGIYIAVSNGKPGTGHIHHYDTQGVFLACITEGLHEPLGISATPAGQVAVADWNSVKIYH